MRADQPDLIVAIPPTYEAERRYVWNVLLQEGLGIALDFRVHHHSETRLSSPGASGCIVVPEGLFACAEGEWLTALTLPTAPVPRLWIKGLVSSADDDVVAIYGARSGESEACRASGPDIEIQFDLAGSAFFMLTRYEEAVEPGDRDEHGRMPSASMLAVRDGFHHRAVVNEYLALLQSCLAALWTPMARRQRSYRVLLSHDVDHAFAGSATWKATLRAAVGDVSRRRDGRLAVRRLLARTFRGSGRLVYPDPYDTFDFLMEVAESNGLASTFNFICGGVPELDADYAIGSPWIGRLMERISARGHELGLHPSYSSADSEEAIATEFRSLRARAREAGVSQEEWGGRHHYLRWNPSSWRKWSEAGLSYDSSLGFADRAGFRSGYCFEYTTFDLAGRQHLALKERPLVVMEKTVYPDTFAPSSLDAALSTTGGLVETCRRFGGDFTLLWHNSKVASRQQASAYIAILRQACAGAR